MSYSEKEKKDHQKNLKKSLKLIDKTAVSRRRGSLLTPRSEINYLISNLERGLADFYPASINAAETILRHTQSQFRNSEQVIDKLRELADSENSDEIDFDLKGDDSNSNQKKTRSPKFDEIVKKHTLSWFKKKLKAEKDYFFRKDLTNLKNQRIQFEKIESAKKLEKEHNLNLRERKKMLINREYLLKKVFSNNEEKPIFKSTYGRDYKTLNGKNKALNKDLDILKRENLLLTIANNSKTKPQIKKREELLKTMKFFERKRYEKLTPEEAKLEVKFKIKFKK